MSTSSQTPPGALPPESPYQRQPVPLGAALAVPHTLAPAVQAAATASEAAAAVIDATIEAEGGATGLQLAEAEARAGILFDPERVAAVRSAAYEQAKAEDHADLTEANRQLAELRTALDDVRRQRDAVLRLCEGRRGDDLLMVAAVAAAAEYGSTALDGVPMTLGWTGTVGLPEGGAREAAAVLECVSSYGGRAHIALTGEQRQALASLLDLEVRDVYTACPTPGCGTAEDFDPSAPAAAGWSRLQVAGVEGAESELRWYCTPVCVSSALARAGAEIAEADHRAELDGGL